MTPEQKVKKELLLQAAEHGDIELSKEISSTNVDDLYDDLMVEEDKHWDYESEFRSGYHCETDIDCNWSRHYESKSVASKLKDGTWIGWTYWYGGGKHGEPENIDWMCDAYELVCTETPKTIIHREFEKK